MTKCMKQIRIWFLGFAIPLGTIIVLGAQLPATIVVAASTDTEKEQIFTYSKDYYTYSFRKGDTLIVILNGLLLYKDSAFRERLNESEEGAVRYQRWVVVSQEVTAENLVGEAVLINYKEKGQKITGWVDGWGLKPLDYKGDIPHEQSLGSSCCAIVGGSLFALLIGIGGLFAIRKFFGPGCVLVLCGLMALGFLIGVIFNIAIGVWGGAAACFVFMLFSIGIGLLFGGQKA